MRRERRVDGVVIVLLFLLLLIPIIIRETPAVVVIIVMVLFFLLVIREELGLVGLFRPEYVHEALLRQWVDVSGCHASRLHPHDEAGVHPYVLVLGTAGVVGELQFGRRAMYVRLGEGDGRAQDRGGIGVGVGVGVVVVVDGVYSALVVAVATVVVVVVVAVGQTRGEGGVRGDGPRGRGDEDVVVADWRLHGFEGLGCVRVWGRGGEGRGII